MKISTFPGADWSWSQETPFPSLSSAPESSLLLLSVTATHQDINPAPEASQVMLLEGAVGRAQGFGHLAIFPSNYYGLEGMFMAFHVSDIECRWLLGCRENGEKKIN